MTVRAVHYDANGEDREIELDDPLVRRVDKNRFLWIDLDNRDRNDLERVAAAIGLEPAGLRRLGSEQRRSQILRLPDQIILTLGAVEPDDDQAARRELDLVIGENHVVTVHDGPLGPVDTFRTDMAHERELGRLDAASFTAGLIDAVLAGFFRQIEMVERDIDALDEVAVRSSNKVDFLGEVVVVRRRIARLRRALAPNREALLPLERPDFGLRSDIGPVWPGINQRLERAIDGLENTRELLVGTFDLYLGRSSQRTNDVMKVLTLVSAIALPGIILAGVMGMNFKLEFFDEPNNFFVVLLAMVIFAAAILGVARFRRWI